MNRKKQGSLSCKITQHKTQASLPKQPQTRNPHNRSPSICQTAIKINQFIEHYQLLKHQYNFNLSSQNIFEHKRLNQNSDDQFFFDVDLGVPYVESQHLDSGFDFEQKQNQSIHFPKISSAKEIFTSVLQISNHSTNQLDEENFTDQEEEQQPKQILNFSKGTLMKKKNRKQTPLIIGKVQLIISEQQQRNSKNKKSNPINHVIQNTYNNTSERQNVMKKLKLTAQFRQEKLKFWNQRLVELQRSENTNKNYPRSSLIYKKTSQFNDIENSFCSNKFNFNNECTLSVKKSKFQKEPTHKKINSKFNVNLIKNKQNISPIRQKYQAKQVINKQLNIKKPIQIMEQNQRINPSSNKDFVRNGKQIILKNSQFKGISNDRNIKKKVF